MTNSQIKKSVLALTLVLIVSGAGFGSAYGYGSSGGSRMKVQVCHNGNTITVARSALDAHLKHGDKKGLCTATPQGQVLGASDFQFNNNLWFGMSGSEVRELQERLRALGHFTFPTSTGYFGTITRQAVILFQRANGIPQTGFVGPLTRAALNK